MLKQKLIIDKLFKSYSNLIFSNSTIVGLFLFLLSFITPSAGIHALIAFFVASIFEKITNVTNSDNGTINIQLYNTILVGLSIGYLFQPSILSVLFTAIASVFTILFTAFLSDIFYNLFRLPILNLPFAIIATIIYLASVRYSSLYVTNIANYNFLNISILPYWASGFFKALGTLIFLPYDVIGILLLILFSFTSLINVFLILTGYYTGTLFHGLLNGSLQPAFNNPYGFNYILISLALGGYFLIPSKKTYGITIIGVAISAIILDAATVFWSAFQIPVFTLPFVMTVLLLLYTLYVYKFPYITKIFMGTPEKNLEQWYLNKERFNTTLPAPQLPFVGEWTVYQGFDDEWTHQGIWKYAVDFVIQDENDSQTYYNSGNELKDYYCYNKPVLSPITGTITAVGNNCLDNPIGTVDKENNWGNYVIIYSSYGYYVELSHFVKDSITVSVGDHVTVGQNIGRCGNSGYSPQPHIHIQCQLQNYVGAPTIPFTFSNAIKDGIFTNKEIIPQKDNNFTPLIFSQKLNNNLLMILEDVLNYKITKNDIEIHKLNLKVKMANDGTYFFEDLYYNNRLYFTHTQNTFAFVNYEGSQDSPLYLFYIALPSIPITESPVTWTDEPPASLLAKKSPFNSFLKSFNHSFFSATGKYSNNGLGKIRGEISVHGLLSIKNIKTEVTFDDSKGLKKVSVTINNNNYQLNRVDSYEK